MLTNQIMLWSVIYKFYAFSFHFRGIHYLSGKGSNFKHRNWEIFY